MTSRRAWSLRCGLIASSLLLVGASSAVGQRVEAVEPNRGGLLDLEALDPQVALEHLHVADGYEIELFASEVDFPIGNPISLTFDAKGRLWLVTAPTYPQRLPDEEPRDKLIILEDRDRDGRADHHTVFADGLHLPVGFELGDGGAYISQQPNLVFARDEDGDDVADRTDVILHGFGTEDSHHSISAFTWGPGGGLYFQEGTFHHSQVETPHGPVRLVDAGVFRYKPDQFRLEVFVSYRFANPWGHVFDRWGQSFIADASGGANYYGTAISGSAPYPLKRGRLKVFTSVVRPTSGCEFVSSGHFPEEAQGNFLINNTIGFQGIKQHRVWEEGAGFASEELEPLLYSTDINFRPVDLQFGPDGALYVVDWFNPLIGHMQYSLRDPRRDTGHGRIWRITAKGRPLLETVDLTELTIPELLVKTTAYEDRLRYRVRRELRARDREEVIEATGKWLEFLESRGDVADPLRLEALWVYQGVSYVEPELLGRLLSAENPRIRAAAQRVLRFWRRNLEGGGALDPRSLNVRALEDPHPRVRLEAVLNLSFETDGNAAAESLRALETALGDGSDPAADDYLAYVVRETLRSLEPHWKPRLGADWLTSLPQRSRRFVLESLPTTELAGLPRGPDVSAERLLRENLSGVARADVVAALGPQPVVALLEVLERSEAHEASRTEAVAHALLEQPAAALRAAATELEDALPRLRRRASRGALLAARVLGGASVGDVIARGSPQSLYDGLEALRRLAAHAQTPESVRDAARAVAVQFVRRLPDEVLDQLRTQVVSRVEVSSDRPRRQLGLGEVEVLSGGENVALLGSASQSSTVADAFASLANDGDARVGAPGTMTASDTRAWWSVELETPRAISEVRVWQRGYDFERVRGATVSFYDASDALLLEVTDLEWRERVATIRPDQLLQARALEVLATLPETGVDPDELTETLQILVEASADEGLRAAAIRSLERVTSAAGPSGQLSTGQRRALRSATPQLAALLRQVPLESLTSVSARAGFALADRLFEDGFVDEPLAALLRERRPIELEVRTVPHQMSFDVTELSVISGRPVSLLFSNVDISPHNLVVTAQGALRDVGLEAEEMALREPDAAERDYVPETPLVLVASRLLNPGESERLTFVAPEEPGSYPFVCTFPGHWLVMNGILHVLPAGSDLPDPAPVQTTESSVRTRRFVRDWTFEELREDVESTDWRNADELHNVERGERLYADLGCATCHEPNADTRIGPDLVAVARDLRGAELLRHVLEPSEKVDPDYETFLVEMRDGRFYSGALVSQDDAAITLRANALDPTEAVRIPLDDARSVDRTPLSPMPSGLLVTLNREEILDLLSYLYASAAPREAPPSGEAQD